MKTDIRVARKVEPPNGNGVSKIYGTRSNRNRNSTTKREQRVEPSSSAVSCRKNSRSGRPIKPTHFLNSLSHTIEASVDATLEKKDAMEKNESYDDKKRRRPNAESYINKRFLYDVTEPPKRSRQQKSLPSHARSTAALMAVSCANLKRQRRDHPTPNNDDSRPRSKRGRPLKNSSALNLFEERVDNMYRNHARGSRNIKNRLKNEDLSIQTNWDTQDLYGDSTTQGIADYSLSNPQTISSLQKFGDPTDMAAYSGVLLNVFDEAHSPDHGLLDTDVGNGPMLRIRGVMSGCRSTNASSGEDMSCRPSDLDSVTKIRNQIGSRRRPRSPLHPTGDAYLAQDQLQSVFPSQRQHSGDEDRTVDLLSLYAEVHPGCFPSQSHLDASALAGGVGRPVDPEEDDLDEVINSGYLSTSSSKQHQRYPLASGRHSSESMVPGGSVEELDEEEDLLSPELSILAGSTVAPGGVTVGAPAGLMEAANESGRAAAAATLLIPQTSATTSGSSSRRKSPVRPMQVIRTKSHAAPTTGGHTVNQQSPPLTSSHLEPSSLILTSSVLNCGSPSVPAFCRRRTSEEVDRVGHGDTSCDLLDQQQHQPDLAKPAPIGASVIRLVPGHPPVVQTFPSAGTAPSSATALSSRQLISTNHTRIQTAGSPASEASDCGSSGLIISTTTSATGSSPFLSGAHPSRLLVSSGSGSNTTGTRPSAAAANGGSTAVASVANSNVVNKTNTSLLSASAASAIAPRRRPTILKRMASVLTSTGAGVLRSSGEGDFPPATQAVASAAVDLEQHQAVSSGTASTVGSGGGGGNATTVAASHGSVQQAPTKLLQLVTAPLPPSHPSASSSSSSSLSSSSYGCTTTAVAAPASTSSMTASDRLFGRRPAPPASLTSYHSKSSTSGAPTATPSDLLVETSRVHSSSPSGNTFNSNTPYRYAVVRGSADGKRYLVLGNHGVFDRNATNVNGSTLDSSSLVPPSDVLGAGSVAGSTGLEQQILPLDPFPVDVVTEIGEESVSPGFVVATPPTTTVSNGSGVPSAGPTLIRRSKGSRFTNLIVTPLPPVSGRAGDVSVATAVT